MALHWDVTRVADYERITTSFFPCPHTGGSKWAPATEALVWLSLHCGFSHIDEKNIDEVARRINIWEQAAGSVMRNDEGDLRVSMQDIRDHIGLWTNATRLTKTEFRAKIFRILEARELPKAGIREHERLRFGRVLSEKAARVADLVAEYEGLADYRSTASDMAYDALRTKFDQDEKELAAALAQTIAHP